jgi:MarR family transcriptional regulator, organic hydroperoxide resistance regulator
MHNLGRTLNSRQGDTATNTMRAVNSGEFQYDRSDESPGFMLWRVSSLWQRRIKAALEPFDLTHTQFVLLAGLSWLGRQVSNITQVQLAEHLGMDVMMTSQVLRTLETKGLIERPPHPTDSRAKALTLTKAGRGLTARAVPVVEAADLEFFARLGKRQGELVKQLRTLQEEA